MSKRQSQVILLCEDKQQRTFVERLLKQLTFKNKIRPLPLPAGRGAGEQYVRQNYATQVQELRRRTGQLQLGLVVVVDADTYEVVDRERQLADELKSAGLSSRAADERVIHFIPKRNIMTWIEFLLRKQQVNETDTYPELKGRERECQPAIDRLVEIFRSNKLPENCPASLVTALTAELPRLR